MKPISLTILSFVLIPVAAISPAAAAAQADDTPGAGVRLSVGCWFWTAAEFAPDGYKRFLDLHAERTAFGLLTTSIRHDVEVTELAVHDQIAEAVAYARERNIGIALDLDVRLARAAFQAKYPDEMQEIVRLREAPLAAEGEIRVRAESLSLGDHYTFRARPYDSIAGRLLRVYSYTRGESGIDPDSVVDVTSRCRVVEASSEAVDVAITCDAGDAGRTLCMMAAFTLFAPDVFAPHLIEFERDIMEQYSDVPLAGVCKDEWGFPGRFEPSTDDLWYSTPMAEDYAAKRPGRDLEFDLLLMSKGMQGLEGERVAAINHWMEMLRERNVAIEAEFYRNVKSVFGDEAYVGTHPTWYPYPGKFEAFKNGLDWWAVRRDIAQTDETTPYCVRTALSKKWGRGAWLNMYYAPSQEAYGEDIWRHALGGGRMNFHPVWPSDMDKLSRSLLGNPVLLADARIRLVDIISNAPIDCPVAVVFGHAAYQNWAGEGFGDAGVELADALWERGIYADLIPTSEIVSHALRVTEDGRVSYGDQRYDAVVMYHPEYEREAISAFMQQVAQSSTTQVFRVGDWTTTFDGEPFAHSAALPEALPAADIVEAIDALVEAKGLTRQTPCESLALHGFPKSMIPKRSGTCRLLDGTVVLASGEYAPEGDALQRTITIEGVEITLDAVGIVAVRIEDGDVVALAGSGLKRFTGAQVDFELDSRADVALWRAEDGQWHGTVGGVTTIPGLITGIEHPE